MEKNKKIETAVEAERSGQKRAEVEGPRAGLRDRGRPQQAVQSGQGVAGFCWELLLCSLLRQN